MTIYGKKVVLCLTTRYLDSAFATKGDFTFNYTTRPPMTKKET